MNNDHLFPPDLTLEEIRERVREGGDWDTDCPGYIARELVARLMACRADRDGLLRAVHRLTTELSMAIGEFEDELE